MYPFFKKKRKSEDLQNIWLSLDCTVYTSLHCFLYCGILVQLTCVLPSLQLSCVLRVVKVFLTCVLPHVQEILDWPQFANDPSMN